MAASNRAAMVNTTLTRNKTIDTKAIVVKVSKIPMEQVHNHTTQGRSHNRRTVATMANKNHKARADTVSHKDTIDSFLTANHTRRDDQHEWSG